MQFIHENQGKQYNIEGLRQDYHSLQALLHKTKDKKERKVLAGWLNQIKQTLEEIGEDIAPSNSV